MLLNRANIICPHLFIYHYAQNYASIIHQGLLIIHEMEWLWLITSLPLPALTCCSLSLALSSSHWATFSSPFSLSAISLSSLPPSPPFLSCSVETCARCLALASCLACCTLAWVSSSTLAVRCAICPSCSAHWLCQYKGKVWMTSIGDIQPIRGLLSSSTQERNWSDILSEPYYTDTEMYVHAYVPISPAECMVCWISVQCVYVIRL